MLKLRILNLLNECVKTFFQDRNLYLVYTHVRDERVWQIHKTENSSVAGGVQATREKIKDRVRESQVKGLDAC